METVAPHDVIAVFDPANPRVILIITISALGVFIDPLNDLVIQFPIDPILAETAMHIHVACLVITTENTRKRTVERHHCAVKNTVGRWDQVPRNDRVSAVAPDYIIISSRSGFPGDIGECKRWG